MDATRTVPGHAASTVKACPAATSERTDELSRPPFKGPTPCLACLNLRPRTQLASGYCGHFFTQVNPAPGSTLESWSEELTASLADKKWFVYMPSRPSVAPPMCCAISAATPIAWLYPTASAKNCCRWHTNRSHPTDTSNFLCPRRRAATYGPAPAAATP